MPAAPVGVGLLELTLVRLAGPPAQQVEVLRQLGEGAADPVAPVLALLTLGAQGLAAYLMLVLGLRLLALLPGVLGRLAAVIALRLTPVAVRRALDLLLGGALLAQVTLAPLTARAAAAPPPLAAVPTTAPAGRPPPPLPPWLTARPQARPSRPTAAPETAPVPAPAGSEAAPVPAPAGPGAVPPTTLPGVPGAASTGAPGGSGPTPAPRPRAGAGAERGAPGAGAAGEPEAPGAGPTPRHGRGRPEGAEGLDGTRAGGAYTIRAGDTLWGIAAAHLPSAKRSAAAIDRYWRQIYRANRAVLGPDPDLIHPGTRLRLPPDQPDRR